MKANGLMIYQPQTGAAHAIYFSFKRTSSQLNLKDFRRVMRRATQKEQATTTLKKNN